MYPYSRSTIVCSQVNRKVYGMFAQTLDVPSFTLLVTFQRTSLLFAVIEILAGGVLNLTLRVCPTKERLYFLRNKCSTYKYYI